MDDTQRDGISRETVSDDDGAGLMGDEYGILGVGISDLTSLG